MNKKTPRESYFHNTFGKKSVDKSYKAEDRDQRAKTERKEQRDAEKGFGSRDDRSERPAYGSKAPRGDREQRGTDKPRSHSDWPAARPAKSWGDRPDRKEQGGERSFDKKPFRAKEGGGDRERNNDRPRRDWSDSRPPRENRDGAAGEQRSERPRKEWSDRKPPRDNDSRPGGSRDRDNDRPRSDWGDRKPRDKDSRSEHGGGRDNDRPRKEWSDRKPPRDNEGRSGGGRDRDNDRPRSDWGDRKPRDKDSRSEHCGGRDNDRPRKEWSDRKPPRDNEERSGGGRDRDNDRPRSDWGDRKRDNNTRSGYGDRPQRPGKPGFGDKARKPRPGNEEREFPMENNRVDYVKVGGKKPASKYEDDEEDDDDDIEISMGATEQMPLNKYIAHCGICSRRDAAEMVKQGKVKVNGELVMEPGRKIEESDVVTVAGKKLFRQRHLAYVLLNKPKGFITTTEDDRGRDTVMQLVASAEIDRLYPIGRLDRNTTGLLIMTNDGELAQKLSHPKYRVKKVYQVTLDKPLTKLDFDKILQGVELEDGPAPVDALSYLEEKNELGIEIHSGRNRIVRRIFESLGYEVEKLDRVMYAGLTKKNLPRGKWRFLTEREVILLKHFKA
jgi:23S rRNA pseudouridine2605 synthase